MVRGNWPTSLMSTWPQGGLRWRYIQKASSRAMESMVIGSSEQTSTLSRVGMGGGGLITGGTERGTERTQCYREERERIVLGRCSIRQVHSIVSPLSLALTSTHKKVCCLDVCVLNNIIVMLLSWAELPLPFQDLQSANKGCKSILVWPLAHFSPSCLRSYNSPL